ncbi:formylglycine-generating enzyme family protein [Sorangium sp. So ce887]|uniref:formylglycine-generating enzyme family protein n=1 Tax=Sorangium sp. So ce887 TaxID=3133324 RepID=UPI003F622C00
MLSRIRTSAGWTTGVFAAIGLCGGCAQILGADWDEYAQGGAGGGGPSSGLTGGGGPGSGGSGGDGGAGPGSGGSGGDGGAGPGSGGSGGDGGAGPGSGGSGGDGGAGPGGGATSSAATSSGTAGGGGSGPGSLPPSCGGTSGSGTGPLCGLEDPTSCCDSRKVDGGTFARTYDDESGGPDDATVSDFYLDRYEVTVERFRAFVNAGRGTQATAPPEGAGARPGITGSGWRTAWSTFLPASTEALRAALKCKTPDDDQWTWTDTPETNEKRPISCLTWYEAFAFCVWDGGRLPTEAEWAYAAAGGAEQRQYPWGSGIGDARALYSCRGDGDLGAACTRNDLLEVGSKSTDGDGLWGQSDLAGSLREWVLDSYDPADSERSSYINPCPDCAQLADSSYRVNRGGSYKASALSARSVRRNHAPANLADTYHGVRCARDR